MSTPNPADCVQVRNPRTGEYAQVDRTRGTITGHAPEPVPGVPIVPIQPVGSDPADAEVEAATRELSAMLHQAVLRETGDPDRALDAAAGAQRKQRQEWEEAKQADAQREDG